MLMHRQRCRSTSATYVVILIALSYILVDIHDVWLVPRRDMVLFVGKRTEIRNPLRPEWGWGAGSVGGKESVAARLPLRHSHLWAS